MTPQTQTLLADYQVRKSKQQKASFRDWLCGELKAAGYTPAVERGRNIVLCHNVVVGDPEKANVLYTAHYDTCAVLPIPNFITPHNFFFYLCYQMIFLLIFFVLALAVEVAVMLAFDLPVWAIPLPAYAVCIFLVWWLLDGKANRHTANDNTSGVAALIELALTLPEEDRDNVCFVFFDNEEKGLFGSGLFAKRHKQVKKNTVVINFDCVSDGDYIHFFPSKKLKRDGETLSRLERAFQGDEGKTVEMVRGFGFYPSDNRAFRRGVGVCALRKKPVIGYYMSRIHTVRDTVFEEENIELLRRGGLALAAQYREELSDEL